MTGTIFFGTSPTIGEANGTVMVPIVRTGDLSGTATIRVWNYPRYRNRRSGLCWRKRNDNNGRGPRPRLCPRANSQR